MMKKKCAAITGVGAYVPPRILTNKDLEKMVDTSDEWITTRTGIKERRIADEETATSDMAVKAAEEALQKANLEVEEIDLIVVATITPDMLFPSTACIVQDKLGARKAACFDLSAGCTGFIYGISVAAQFIENGTYQNALVIGAETLSKIVNWEDRNTCVLFGDGAGAVVLKEVAGDAGILSTYLGSDGSGSVLLKQPAGGSRMPASLDTVEQKLHSIHMNGNDVFKFAVKVMGEASLTALEKCGMGKEDIDFLVPHQANSRIIQSAIKRLKLPEEKVVVNLNKYGNMSSASIPVALYEALQDNKISSGDIIVMVGFGAGLTWGASVVKWL
ncbi:MAG: 3-oxoacyl-[acyl-carrier-protein] synthase [Clostridia bacterium]|jgi:3-oxoacyl-[acyl-carrier-protein] synthase-3|nr:3-oxoacyl-(acyl-carrier-protein) synthase [Clostridiales bacterium]MDK2984750.1 3-oxoacyl-[acyl-carrier-protein] synthase [Clostridia bacterium]